MTTIIEETAEFTENEVRYLLAAAIKRGPTTAVSFELPDGWADRWLKYFNAGPLPCDGLPRYGTCPYEECVRHKRP